MINNYFEIDEEKSIGAFLKDVKDKKNSHYIILDTKPRSYVEFRTMALKGSNTEEKLKSMKRPLSTSEGSDNLKHTHFLIESGDRVVGVEEGVFDIFSALRVILESSEDFLKDKIENVVKDEIFALNFEDKVSTAKNLFLKQRVNLLPILEKNRVVGELRSFDLLSRELHHKGGGLYDNSKSDSTMNVSVSNLMNSRPITLDRDSSIAEAIKIMIEKNLPSLIVTENSDEIYSIVSHRDIFKLFKKDSLKKEFLIDLVGVKDLFEDELDIIYDYSERSMEKMIRMADYDSLKITFKSLGNTDGGHMRKFKVDFMLSKGMKVITVSKEISSGTSDTEFNDKVKGSWNIPQMVQQGLKALEKKVIDEKSKRKK